MNSPVVFYQQYAVPYFGILSIAAHLKNNGFRSDGYLLLTCPPVPKREGKKWPKSTETHVKKIDRKAALAKPNHFPASSHSSNCGNDSVQFPVAEPIAVTVYALNKEESGEECRDSG